MGDAKVKLDGVKHDAMELREKDGLLVLTARSSRLLGRIATMVKEMVENRGKFDGGTPERAAASGWAAISSTWEIVRTRRRVPSASLRNGFRLFGAEHSSASSSCSTSPPSLTPSSK